MRKKTDNSGFTLMEMIVVIAVIAAMRLFYRCEEGGGFRFLSPFYLPGKQPVPGGQADVSRPKVR